MTAALRVAVFSTKAYDRRFLDAANRGFAHRIDYFEARLDASTAVLAAVRFTWVPALRCATAGMTTLG